MIENNKAKDMKERRVVITGMGVVSPVGNSVEEFWQHLTEGYCGIDYIKGYDDTPIPVRLAGQIRDFDPKKWGVDAASIRRSDTYCQYAIVAAIQAMEQCGLESGANIAPERLGVYIGSGIGGIGTFVNESSKLIEEGAERISPLFIPMMISNIAAGNVAIRFNAQGPCLPVVTACATGTHAAGEAYRAIRYGYADAIITGGAEAAVHPIAIGGFANSKALSRSEKPDEASLPFDAKRGGFVIAEGAGILVMEEYEHAVERGATIYAEVCGYGNSCDAHHYTAPRPDGSANNSFPSGHTATTFMGAELVRIEYGDESPWYSVGAYAVATTVGVLRVYNERHWFTDVFAGAGVGILSARIGHWLLPYTRKMMYKLTGCDAFIYPSVSSEGASLGFAMQF